MKFQVYQSLWGMVGLPYGADEWSLEEKVEQIAAAGFDGVEFLMEDPDNLKAMLPLVEKHGLKRSNIIFPWTPDDIDADINERESDNPGERPHGDEAAQPMRRILFVEPLERQRLRGCLVVVIAQRHHDRRDVEPNDRWKESGDRGPDSKQQE